ncbi:MAG: T9SS type A sorting domain-containing protein [Ignavibacteria bacterium]
MKKLIFILIIFILIGKTVLSQDLLEENWGIINNGNGSKIEDIQFYNEDIIYMVALENGYSTHVIKKSTNRGYSWQTIGSLSAISGSENIEKGASICLLDQNTGILACNDGLYKFNSNGLSLKKTFEDNGVVYKNEINKVIYTGQSSSGGNVLYALLTFGKYISEYLIQDIGKIYKSTDQGETWQQVYRFAATNTIYSTYFEDIDFDKNDGNKLIVCGYQKNKIYGNTNQFLTSYLFPTNDGFLNVNAESFTEANGALSNVCIKPNGEIIHLFRGSSMPNIVQLSKVFKQTWGSWNTQTTLLSFVSEKDKSAIQHGMVFTGNDKGYIIVNSTINNTSNTRLYKTNDGGLSWSISKNYLFGSYLQDTKCAISFRQSNNTDLVFFSPSDNNLYIKRIDGINFTPYTDKITSPLDGVTLNTSNPNQGSYTTPLSETISLFPFITTISIEGDNDNRIFYKWSDNSTNSINNKYMVSLNPSDLYYKNITAIYKGKNNADNHVAINNPNQVKALRDSIGTIHQIYESIGGIFYSRSTNNGESFQREEIVNAGNLWNLTYPENKSSASENRNPSLCEIRNLMGGRPLSISNVQNSITACWEHYIPTSSNSVDVEIKVASRQTNGGIDWYKYGTSEAMTNLHGVIKTFPASSGFVSKPVIYASAYKPDIGPCDYSNPYNQFLLVPHFEPSSNGGKKIVVTAKYKGYGISPMNGSTNDFIIADGNSDGLITDYSVTAMPTYNNYIYNGYELHFAYLRGNLIKYSKVSITFNSIGMNEFQILMVRAIPTEELISYADGLLNRSAPDISMKNGYPIICYSGYWIDNRYVYYEENNDNPQLLSIHHYPIWIKYKNASGNWISFGYDNLTPQTNPNVEGAIRDNAFLLSFKKFSKYFQFVRFDVPENYYCFPSSYNETDAKLIKGSYINKNGKLGTINTTGLLTLSNPNQGIYSVGNKPFEITNNTNPSIENDGFSNLIGTIDKNNISYIFSVGPILVSNTTQSYDDDTPPQTIQNPVEFNETMKSAAFSLSNNDTLILGSYGSFLTTVASTFEPIKYHVNLVNFTSGSIHRELFRDTIKIEDSIGISYLRGYVINNIPNGTDSFFVQMVVDTVDAGDGDYNMAGVYADDTPPQGDAPINYKTKVFFENSSNSLTSGNQIPKEYSLSQNYPNPFNPSTTIKYSLPKDGFVSLKIYDITGREVKSLAGEVKKAGYYSVTFNASSLASGVYFYRIQSNDYVMTKRMVLIK